MKGHKPFLWFTDLGFIAYWLITALKLLPAEGLFNDYINPILVAWNWSFLPQLCASFASRLHIGQVHTLNGLRDALQ
jgi:hypothetical protein